MAGSVRGRAARAPASQRATEEGHWRAVPLRPPTGCRATAVSLEPCCLGTLCRGWTSQEEQQRVRGVEHSDVQWGLPAGAQQVVIQGPKAGTGEWGGPGAGGHGRGWGSVDLQLATLGGGRQKGVMDET
ncbi:hypothetical protein HJG60_010185 [Phyllostomus discolor]|uniref:Uncharacterized protein n=1 Tax=Phyllostomus discolor TaxID=89673 RepID=A0A834AWF6_9CHIR|nr:hypothetical protein HJG60_010185 [Phyllostomus discolor]